jgi:phosphoglycerol transferase MdoB-like AlkP superfamily enzyme
MPPLLASLATRLTLVDALSQHRVARLAPVAAFHLAALAVMLWSEISLTGMAVFVATWGLLNFFWLVLLRRPGLSAALSFAMLAALIVVSRFKFQVLWMTASFIDVMIIDSDTFAFLWMMFPKVRTMTIVAVVLAVPLVVLLWKIDPFRVRRWISLAGAAACLAAITGLSILNPVAPGEAFGDENYVSHFARSGVDALAAYSAHGFLESDAEVVDRLKLVTEETCQAAAGKRPHIILVHDESSFDMRAVNGAKVPPNYGGHFRSFDGKARKFLVEGAGGPSWYTEYNVLSGLSARSYGRFQFFVTRIAAGRVVRGLPNALRRCGYQTHAIYPAFGGFLGASSFYKGAGVQNFADGKDIGGGVFEPDRFYFDVASRTIARERGRGPMFLYVYLTANHFTWDYPFHAELTPAGWRSPGNAMPEVDEFLRRQAMSEHDYAAFLARLKRDFPGEPFLIVRYGDHQPDFAKLIIDPAADVMELGRRLMNFDPRYYTTYYAIDAVNFRPVDTSSALDVLDAPYLPLVMQEAAGLPLDPSFVEQKRILERCKGLFYGCAGGAEARRFNRLLIDAGLIKGL